MVLGAFRKFKGKRFKMWNKYPNKRDAEKAKKHLKKKGYRVRIMKHTPYGTNLVQRVVYYRKTK